jgi:hypothetical protein
MASAGDVAGASWWVEFPPLAISAQVGAVRKGVQWGGVCSCCGPAHQLDDQPSTPGGEAGGQGWGGSLDQYCRALTPRPHGGGRCGVGPGAPRDPCYPSILGRGQGAGGEARVGDTSTHDECWQGTGQMLAGDWTNVGRGLVKCRQGTGMNVGRGLDECWQGTGQMLAGDWTNVGRGLDECWQGTGRMLAGDWMNVGRGLDECWQGTGRMLAGDWTNVGRGLECYYIMQLLLQLEGLMSILR